MKNKSFKLNEFIQIMKERYPYYKYINAISDKSVESTMIEAGYTIIVKNIPRESMKEFISYIKESILMPCVDKDEELPLIITIQEKLPCGTWPLSCEKSRQQLVFDNIMFEYAIAA